MTYNNYHNLSSREPTLSRSWRSPYSKSFAWRDCFVVLLLAMMILISFLPLYQVNAQGIYSGAIFGAKVGQGIDEGKSTTQAVKDAATDFVSPMWNGFLAILGKVIGFIIFLVTYLIGYIAGIGFIFAGLFLSFGLQLNGSLLQSPTVNIGWSIARDLANLGFVLAIIFIAFATILRLNKYGLKQTLWRLVVVAVLINFSLTLAGILIDGSGLVTNLFISKVVPNTTSAGGLLTQPYEFSKTISGAFGVQNLLKVDDLDLKKYNGITEFGATMISAIANLFFVTMFTLAGATVMWITAALVFVRYVTLTILLILMPLAWIGWIFPGSELSKAQSIWWSKFIEWIIWLPVTSFFIYLVMLIVYKQSNDLNSLDYIAKSVQQAPQGNVLDQMLGFVTNSFETFGRMIAIIALWGGGLVAAGKISDHGAKSAIGFVNQGRDYMTGKVKGAGGYLGGRAWQTYLRGGGRPAQFNDKGEKTAEAVAPRGARLANLLTKVPGLSGTASNIGNYMAKGKGEVEEYQKKYLSNLSDDAVLNYSELGGPVAIAAKAAELAKRNKLDKISEDKLPRYADAVRKAGAEKDFVNNRPDLALKYFGKHIKDVMKKITDITTVAEAAFKDINVLSNLSVNQLKTLGSSDKVSEALKESIRKSVKENVGKIIQFKVSGGQLTSDQQETQKKLQYINKLVNTPAWSIQELRQIKREEIKEFKDTLTSDIRELKENLNKDIQKIKDAARDNIERIARNTAFAPAVKDAEIANAQQERNQKIADLEKINQTQMGKIDKNRLAADTQLKKEVEEINRLFK